MKKDAEMTDNKGFGLRKDAENDKVERGYHLNAGEWCELFGLIYLVVQEGAAVSVYTNRDGNALCVAVKHGTDRTASWIGPDDAPYDIINGVFDKWGVQRRRTPIEEWVDIALEDDRRAGSDD